MFLEALKRLLDIPTLLLAYILFYLTSLLPYDSPLTPILHLLFVSYTSAFLISRHLQRRGSVDNPFRYALLRTPHTAISLIFIFIPTYTLLFNIALGFVLLLLWLPLSLPLLAASVIEKMPGRDIIYEALLAGKQHYLSLLLSLLLGLILSSLFFYLSLLSPPYTTPLTPLFTTLYLASLSLTAYTKFREG